MRRYNPSKWGMTADDHGDWVRYKFVAELRAEVERLNDLTTRLRIQRDEWMARAKKAEAEVERLKELLRDWWRAHDFAPDTVTGEPYVCDCTAGFGLMQATSAAIAGKDVQP
jgi:hypothetical protein